MIKRHQKMQRNGLISDKIYKQKAFDPQIIIIWVFHCININLLIYFRRIFGMGNLNYEQSGQNIIQVDFNPHETNSIQQIVPRQLSSQSIPLNHHLYDALNNHPTSNEQNYNIYELTSNASTNSNGINQIPRQMITYHNPRSDIDESCKLEQLSKISLQTEQNSRQQDRQEISKTHQIPVDSCIQSIENTI